MKINYLSTWSCDRCGWRCSSSRSLCRRGRLLLLLARRSGIVESPNIIVVKVVEIISESVVSKPRRRKPAVSVEGVSRSIIEWVSIAKGSWAIIIIVLVWISSVKRIAPASAIKTAKLRVSPIAVMGNSPRPTEPVINVVWILSRIFIIVVGIARPLREKPTILTLNNDGAMQNREAANCNRNYCKLYRLEV